MDIKQYQTGGIVAFVSLSTCFTYTDIETNAISMYRDRAIAGIDKTWFEVFNHEYTLGPFCWILTDVKTCEFIECRGGQGLWDYKNE